jgi:hypothetical protein
VFVALLCDIIGRLREVLTILAYAPGQGVHIDHPAIVEILISQLDSQRET